MVPDLRLYKCYFYNYKNRQEKFQEKSLIHAIERP